jgi:hypothetical protein
MSGCQQENILHFSDFAGKKDTVEGQTFLHSICLNIFHRLARKPNLEKISIYSNKFFPVLLVPSCGKVGSF